MLVSLSLQTPELEKNATYIPKIKVSVRAIVLTIVFQKLGVDAKKRPSFAETTINIVISGQNRKIDQKWSNFIRYLSVPSISYSLVQVCCTTYLDQILSDKMGHHKTSFVGITFLKISFSLQKEANSEKK